MAVKHIPPKGWSGRSDPEDGSHAKRMHHYVGTEGSIAIIGFACDAGVVRNKGRAGARSAPAAIRRSLAGLAAPAQAKPFVDLGDIEVDGGDLEEGQSFLSKQLARALSQYLKVIVIGGGHETAYGSFTGLRAQYPNDKIGIINLDAHLDLRELGDVGASSGTPFNQIRNLDPENFDYLCIGVAEESNTQALFKRAADWNVRIITDHALIESRSAADDEIQLMAGRCDHLYLTVDIDLLPYYQAPGVSAPAARGVPLEVVEHLIRTVIASTQQTDCSLQLMDIVEVSPPNDVNNMTAKSAALLVRQMMSASC